MANYVMTANGNTSLFGLTGSDTLTLNGFVATVNQAETCKELNGSGGGTLILAASMTFSGLPVPAAGVCVGYALFKGSNGHPVEGATMSVKASLPAPDGTGYVFSSTVQNSTGSGADGFGYIELPSGGVNCVVRTGNGNWVPFVTPLTDISFALPNFVG